MRTISFLRRAAVGAALLSIAACGGDSATTGPAGCSTATAQCVAGAYKLQTINGKTLPAFIDGNSEQWSALSMTLSANGTITGSLTWKEYNGATVVDSGTDTFTGSYTITGANSLKVLIEDDTPLNGTYGSDGSLTLVDTGIVLVLKK
jgi:hypothetical protein